MECIEVKMSEIEIQGTEISTKSEMKETIDPFCEQLIERLLQKVDFPKSIHAPGYFLLHDIDLPNLKVGSSITLGEGKC